MSAPTGRSGTEDRSVLHEELRFAKKQQWYVAASAVALNAGILAFLKGIAFSGIELLGVVFCVLLISFGGFAIVLHLQDHMQRTRHELNPNDAPWVRNSDVIVPLSAPIIASALIGLCLLRVHTDVWPSA
jgi:hypothetical protein